VRAIKPTLIEISFGCVEDVSHRDGPLLDWWATAMTQCGGRIHLVLVGEKWNYFAPRSVARPTDSV
jgi:hypothetical protein